MGYAYKGIKMAIAGLLLVVNDQAWLWTPISAWLLVGLILMVLGLIKIIWPCKMVNCTPAKPAKKGK